MEALQCRAVGGGVRHRIVRKVCHLTSVHRADDVRITHKECASLAEAGWCVHLVAQGDLPSGLEGVVHHPLPPAPSRRWQRIAGTTQRVYRKAKEVGADIYHFHDPELIPAGMLLKFTGKKVVYDVHEDVPRDILTKKWLPRYTRLVLAGLMNATEHISCSLLDGLVAATPTIAERFPAVKTACVRNFPRLSDFTVAPRMNSHQKPASFAYIGLINQARGLNNMLQAAAIIAERAGVLINLDLAGPLDEVNIKEAIHRYDAEHFVHYHGCLDRTHVAGLLNKARAGLVVLQPLPSFRDALPVKMFEYMAAGLPVIASDFPLWRKVVHEAQCGLLVDPLDTKEIARAMQWVVDHPDESRAMGQRGRKAVEQTFNWENEASALLNFYERVAFS